MPDIDVTILNEQELTEVERRAAADILARFHPDNYKKEGHLIELAVWHAFHWLEEHGYLILAQEKDTTERKYHLVERQRVTNNHRSSDASHPQP